MGFRRVNSNNLVPLALPLRIITITIFITEGEIKSIKEGLESCGFDIGLKGASSCPIAMIVCQKRHNTRFFFKDKNGQYLNPCPGLCSDAIGGEHSISR